MAVSLKLWRVCVAARVVITSDTGNGYYGAYQFDKSTWGNFGGYNNPAQAPADVQDQKAWETYKRRGWQPWPSCKIKMGLQDIYR